jgi:hypothetical protein
VLKIPLSFFELCGDDEYADLRKAVYLSGTNVILLCVAVDNPEFIGKQGKFNNNLDHWSQELIVKMYQLLGQKMIYDMTKM